MAELIYSNKKSKFVLEPLYYEQKQEYWFAAGIAFLQDKKKLIRGIGSLHIGDFQLLIYGIRSLINNKKNQFMFDPIEPHLKILMQKKNKDYTLEVDFCNGPLFEPSQYIKIKLSLSRV